MGALSVSINHVSGDDCRGEHYSPAEKRGFSDFPKEKTIFPPSAADFTVVKSVGDQWSPLHRFFYSLRAPGWAPFLLFNYC